jgi:hypothetical protein
MISKFKIHIFIALVFLIFGTLTIFSGGRALFSEIGINTRGNIVPVVLWFNFIAGFFYLISSFLIFKLIPLVKQLSITIAILNVIIFSYLIYHIFDGGLFENKTVFAMGFRTVFWLIFAIYFHKSKLFSASE